MNSTIRKLARFFFSHILPERGYKVLSGPLKSEKFVLGSLAGDGKGATVYFNMTEKAQTELFVKNVKKDDVVFDIGANVGYYSILASSLIGSGGQIFAFEPVARNIHYLYQHIKLNSKSNISIIPLACSEKNDLNVFSFGPNPAMGHLLNDNTNFSGMNDTIVYSISVDFFTQKFSLKPSVFKIDVEGAELSVLKGAIDTITEFKPIIFLSTHSEQLKQDCMSFLAELDYSFEEIKEGEEASLELICKVK